MINQNTLKILEYYQVMKIVSSFAYSHPGKDALMHIEPFSNIDDVKRSLQFTEEADKLMYEMCINVSFGIDEIDESLELAHKGLTLNCEQLLKIAKALRVAKIAKKNIINTPEYEFILLKELCNSIFVATDLDEKINKCIISENEVSSNASSKLAFLRGEIINTNRKIREKLNSYISKGEFSSILQDNLITIRNNRYVIPVKTAYKGSVKGLIHDQSATGSTTYIEPIAIVELNNELRTLQIEEEQEIEKILRNLSQEIDASYYQIKSTYETLIQLDVIFAKAAYSRSIKGIKPLLNENKIIDIISGRHPLLDKNKVVPVSIALDKNFNTLLISGPNTGGKTVSIKLVGILTLMAMSGLYIPARENSQISIFEDILCDIGDNQSIENNLSTFSAHLKTIIEITDNATNKCLVLLDELGAGTDPIEGAALAIAVISYLKDNHIKTIVTSHYKELKEFAYSKDDINIAGMDFEPITFKPTYKLLMGQTASSNALEIAKLLGLNNCIVENAKSLISEEDNNFNNIIKGAEINRREAQLLVEKADEELKKAEEKSKYYDELIQKVEEKKAKLEEKLAKSAKEVLGDYLQEAEDLVEELKEKVAQADEKALFEARILKKKLENMNGQSKEKIHVKKISGPIEAGDEVFIKTLNNTGVVIAIHPNGKNCTVKVGTISSIVKLKDLERIETIHKNKEENNVKVHFIANYSENITRELNIIGKNSDDALYELEDYLYKAKANNYNEVRIVHGKGAGVIRKIVQEYLKTCPIVEKFRLGEYGEGDGGVTIVTLKQ